MYPWLDYNGRLSPLKLVVFVALFMPGVWVALAYDAGWLGAQPILEAERQIGLWALRLLFVSLAITPLREILRWPRLTLVRRMIGVAVFAYLTAHLALYIVDQAFDLEKVLSEIVLRIYLTIGLTALIGAGLLAATSTDNAIRRLGGRRWQRLHRLIYVVALLAVIHYFMQSKLDEWEPTIMAGFLAWLMSYRVLSRRYTTSTGLPIWLLGLMSLFIATATAVGEAVYFWVSRDINPLLVLPVNFSLDTGVRPALVVLAVGLLVCAVGAIRSHVNATARS